MYAWPLKESDPQEIGGKERRGGRANMKEAKQMRSY